MNFPRTLFFMVGAAALSLVVAKAQPRVTTQIWDPPAIKVFPKHVLAAGNPEISEQMIEDGRQLFETRFNVRDGAGRPKSTGDSKPTPRLPQAGATFQRLAGPDANSCSGCHNQPAIGGSGDFVANVFVGAHMSDPPTTTISANITNERNTLSLFGGGVIEVLAREMTSELRSQRDKAISDAKVNNKDITVPLTTKGIRFGYLTARSDGSLDTSEIEGLDDDLIVRPFGAKGVAASLREFTVFALNQHHGIQAIERFGWERTGIRDFDGDGVDVEFTIGQVSALVLFQAALKAPSRRTSNDNITAVGEHLFTEIGCAYCHRPRLPIASNQFQEPNLYNRPGAATAEDLGKMISIPIPYGGEGSGLRKEENGFSVAAYTDLKRHKICDPEISHLCNEQVRQDNVPTDQFITAKLWDLATSAPYCHRGDCSTVSEAILHHGGDARESRDRFVQLSDEKKLALVAFLLTLGDGQNVAK